MYISAHDPQSHRRVDHALLRARRLLRRRERRLADETRVDVDRAGRRPPPRAEGNHPRAVGSALHARPLPRLDRRRACARDAERPRRDDEAARPSRGEGLLPPPALDRRSPRRPHRADARGRGRGTRSAHRARPGAQRAPRRVLQARVGAVEGHAATDGRQRRSCGRSRERRMSSSCQDCRAGGPTGIARTLTTVVVAVASVLVLALAGCASTDGIASNAKLVAPATLGAAPAAASVAAEWWRGFDDPVLDDLIARATAGNPSLRVAAARTARASANVAAADAARAPLVTGSLDATRQRFSENSLYPPPLAGSVQNTATAQLNGSWELDFFGRNRAQLESAIGSERAAVADADAARVLLAVNVARSYVQLARLLEQRAVLDRVLAQRDEVFSLTRQRVDAGLDTNVELRQSEGFLPETRQQIEATDE